MNSFSRLLIGTLAATLMAACQSNAPESAIQRVDYFHLKTLNHTRTDNPMINHQPSQYLHGAISTEERLQRLGNYYTVTWGVENHSAPVTLRFEYRQAYAGTEIREQVVTVDNIRKNNKTNFQITGNDYATDGRVVAWRISLEQDNNILGQETSFLWN